MDLRSQYKQAHPEAFQARKPAPMMDEYGRTYTGMIAFVMRLSGGRIRDARTASYALAIAAGIILTTALAFFYLTAGSDINTRKNFIPAEAFTR